MFRVVFTFTLLDILRRHDGEVLLANCLVHKLGPEPIVINGVSYNPYKWPKINGQLGLFHPTYRSSFTRFITGDAAHLVYTYYINTYPNISVLQCWVVYPPGNEHITSCLALLKIIFFFSRWDMLVPVLREIKKKTSTH